MITEVVPSVRSVALGLWVRTGSRDEAPEEAGVSHFLEHLLFKGTERHSAIEISELFDGMGAATNAATSKETTHLHARFLDEHTEEAFDLMGEMLLAPSLPPDEIDSERQVVLEEIAMYEDEPSDRVHDVLAEAIHGEHPLGRRVLGHAEVIASIPVGDIAGYHDGRYTAPNIVVAAAGHLEHERIVGLAAERLRRAGANGAGSSNNGGPAEAGTRLLFYPKETEQYHICFGGPGISRADDRRFALGVLDAVFGGSVSSRLFREVREKRGLAYSVGTSLVSYRGASMTWGYTATKNERVPECLAVIEAEILRLKTDGPSDEELAKAKDYLTGSYALGFDTSTKIAHQLAQVAFEGLGIDYIARRNSLVAAVTQADIARAAERTLGDGKLLVVVAGRPVGL
ncbi:MAG: M16 family metallopeptidase [Microvirga sp.]